MFYYVVLDFYCFIDLSFLLTEVWRLEFNDLEKMNGAALVAIAATIGNFLQGWDNATIAGYLYFWYLCLVFM